MELRRWLEVRKADASTGQRLNVARVSTGVSAIAADRQYIRPLRFLHWAIRDGQAELDKLKCVPLPPVLAARTEAKLDRVTFKRWASVPEATRPVLV